MKIRFLCSLFLCCIFFGLNGYAQQTKKERLPSYFGLQVKPIIPGDFLSKSKITLTDGNFNGTFTQQLGYSFGGIIRFGISPLISIETGINQVKRNYKIDFSLTDSAQTASTGFGILSYDIPLNAMIYFQLSKTIFANTSMGTSFVYYPSNVGNFVLVGDDYLFRAEGRRNKFFDIELNANFGFELRSKKNGFFYLGASAKLPFAPIFKVAASYDYKNNLEALAIGDVNGGYISMDFRYFFPNIANKGIQFKKGPIEQ